jgi:hypothetical protein
MAARKEALESISPSQLSFETLCQFLEKLRESKGKLKRKVLDMFISRCIDRESRDAFTVFRLVLPAVSVESLGERIPCPSSCGSRAGTRAVPGPCMAAWYEGAVRPLTFHWPCLQLDEKRGNYKLQEQKLIDVLLKAQLMDPKSNPTAKMIKGWKRPGRKGDAAGDLAKVLEQVRPGALRRQFGFQVAGRTRCLMSVKMPCCKPDWMPAGRQPFLQCSCAAPLAALHATRWPGRSNAA